MNVRLALLILSLLGNLSAAVFWWRATPADSTPRIDAVDTTSVTASPTSPRQPDAILPAWERLDHGDLPALVRSLRRAGFPPTLIRALAQARADADLRALKERIGHPIETEVYWLKPEKPTKEQAETVANHQAATARQIDRLLHDLEADLPATIDALAKKHGPFTPEKLAALERIGRDYHEIRATRLSGLSSQNELRDAHHLLEQERLADFAAVLGPDDMREYRLRHSDLASHLRYGLAPLNVTEAEFRAIFDAADLSSSAHSGREATFASLMAGDQPQLAEARAALLQGLSTVLPPERLADLQLMFDPTLGRERRLISRLNLPLHTAPKVHELRTELETLASVDRAALAAEQQEQVLAREAALRAELKTLLGPDGYAAYNSIFRAPLPAATSTPRP